MGVSKVLRKISSRGAKCSAVVVAAGKATRMEGTDKIMAELCGEPLIVHTLRAFQNAQDVVEIVLVTREELLGAESINSRVALNSSGVYALRLGDL